MAYDSQEQMIYRSLASQIQLGFYDGGARFPSAQEIAGRFGVSYCPAQRALKALEREGLVRLCRGRETEVLAKPYVNYLDSPVFRARAEALDDLDKSLLLISHAVALQGCRQMGPSGPSPEPKGRASAEARRLYGWFDQMIRALGSQTVLSLFYDIGHFAGSAYLDILTALHGEDGAAGLLHDLAKEVERSTDDCRNDRQEAAAGGLNGVGLRFFGALEQYGIGERTDGAEQVPFRWEPHKGRTRHCDVIAIDLVCKINMGLYPVGGLLPTVAELADTYHVSPITIRRTVGVLNQLGVTNTINGVGTHVIFAGDASTLEKRGNLMLDENLLGFLEALQLLAILSESVVGYSFPHFSAGARRALLDAADQGGQKAAMVAVISACMQAVVRDCPLAAVREICGQLTLLMVKGSVLRLRETGQEEVAAWPELSRELRESLAAEDGPRFARVFRRLAFSIFSTTRQTLLEMKVAGAERVAVPLK